MIFYFTGTGNCLALTHYLAKDHERMINIAETTQNEKFNFWISPNESVGIICPTYFLGIPHMVKLFLENVSFSSPPAYIYLVLSCGSYAGDAQRFVRQTLAKKTLPLHAVFTVRQVDNYLPIFTIPSHEKQYQINIETQTKCAHIRSQILQRDFGDFNDCRGPFPRWFSLIAYYFYDKFRKTKKFKINHNCIKCKKCESICPSQAIKMNMHGPEWIKPKCEFCMACINRCPTAAINYGKSTEKHGRFVHPILKPKSYNP